MSRKPIHHISVELYIVALLIFIIVTLKIVTDILNSNSINLDTNNTKYIEINNTKEKKQ